MLSLHCVLLKWLLSLILLWDEHVHPGKGHWKYLTSYTWESCSCWLTGSFSQLISISVPFSRQQ